MAAPGGLGREVAPGPVAEVLAVVFEVAAAGGDAALQHLQLSASDTGQDVAHPVVVADLAVLVMRRIVPRLGGEFAGVVRQLLVIRDQHSAAGRGDDLVAVEGEDAEPAEDTGTSTTALG